MRRRGVKNIDTRILNAEGIVILDAKNYKGKWKNLFNNENPIYLEIGMGKGDFIIEHAKNNPNINYLGLEKYPSVLIQAYDKLKDENISNLHLIVFDATSLLEVFEENEISKIYLNFSDPWPKARHAKRRLTYHTFLTTYKEILKPKGEIEFKTDNRGLFEFSILEMNNFNMKFKEISLDLHNQTDKYIIKTEYEKKFIAKGNVIYYIKVEF